MKQKKLGGGRKLSKTFYQTQKIVVVLFLLIGIVEVNALTSNEVTYENEGNSETLTNTIDTLYSELKEYRTNGSVTSSGMLEGYTGYSKGKLISGSIPSKGSTTYTPGVNNQVITRGQYLSEDQVILGDSNLKAENIKSGTSLFGVNGTFTSDATASSDHILSGKTAYVNGNKITGSLKDLYETATIKHSVDNATSVVPLETMYVSENTDGVTRLELQYTNPTEMAIIRPWTLFGIDYNTVKDKLGITENKIAKGQEIGGVYGTYTSDATAIPSQIMSGQTAYVNGNKITGTHHARNHMPNLIWWDIWTTNNGEAMSWNDISYTFPYDIAVTLLLGASREEEVVSSSNWTSNVYLDGVPINQFANMKDNGTTWEGLRSWIFSAKAGQTVKISTTFAAGPAKTKTLIGYMFGSQDPDNGDNIW